jgi:transposase
MAKVAERLQAEKLRGAGMSIGAIATKLKVSKASASVWCKDVILTKKQRDALEQAAISGGHKGRLMGAETNRKRKQARIAHYLVEGKRVMQKLSQREFMIAGTAIYWGEGSKKSQLAFINSDKDMILFMYQWFRVAFGIKEDQFIFRVFINDLHRDRKEIIEQYWSHLLHVPLSRFRKMIFIKRSNSKRYANHETYYGLLSIRTRNSSDLKYRILGLIDGLKYSKF